MFSFHDHNDLLLFLQVLSNKVETLVGQAQNLLLDHIKEQRRLNRSLSRDKIRVTWDAFVGKVKHDHFRRMFRMPLEAFNELCRRLCCKVSEQKFQPEEYLRKRISNCTVPLIAGEVKVAVSIRIMAGGSYLDLVPLFDISISHLYNLFGEFLDWVLCTFEFRLVKWLRERQGQVLMHLANQFAEKSNGLFFGPFASLDGLAVRIRSPRLIEVPDPGNYYCRKGFYALNVRGICDKMKRFFWCYPSNKGSTHDAAAFGGSRLSDLLKEMSRELTERGLFIAGGSTYALSPFLLIPYDTEDVLRNNVDGAMDSFNFHLSSCRIFIECAFGELIMRWGIFGERFFST